MKNKQSVLDHQDNKLQETDLLKTITVIHHRSSTRLDNFTSSSVAELSEDDPQSIPGGGEYCGNGVDK